MAIVQLSCLLSTCSLDLLILLDLVYAVAASLSRPMISRPLTSTGRPCTLDALDACDWLLQRRMSASHASSQYPPLAQMKTTHRIARRSQLSGTVLGTEGLRHAGCQFAVRATQLTAPELNHQPLNQVVVVRALPCQNFAGECSVHTTVVHRLLHILFVSLAKVYLATPHRLVHVLNLPVE